MPSRKRDVLKVIQCLLLAYIDQITALMMKSTTTTMIMTKSILLLTVLVAASVAVAQEATVEYGTDISFPMHYDAVSTNYAWLPHK